MEALPEVVGRQWVGEFERESDTMVVVVVVGGGRGGCVQHVQGGGQTSTRVGGGGVGGGVVGRGGPWQRNVQPLVHTMHDGRRHCLQRRWVVCRVVGVVLMVGGVVGNAAVAVAVAAAVVAVLKR